VLKALHTGFFNFKRCPVMLEAIENGEEHSHSPTLRHQSALRAMLFRFRCTMGVGMMLFSRA
jgi:hypothetical protein